MDFAWDEEYREFRDELRGFIAEWRTPELLEEYGRTYGGDGPELRRFREALQERGWMRMCWPVDHQIHGGNGVIEENDLDFFTLRGKERSLAWGAVDECLAIAAGSIERPEEWLC